MHSIREFVGPCANLTHVKYIGWLVLRDRSELKDSIVEIKNLLANLENGFLSQLTVNRYPCGSCLFLYFALIEVFQHKALRVHDCEYEFALEPLLDLFIALALDRILDGRLTHFKLEVE